MGTALASLKNRFSEIVRNARTSARMLCSHVWGLPALDRTSRAHSLIVYTPAMVANLA
jgi:hypothetical protein